MLSRDAIDGMFAKRKASEGGVAEAPGGKKKKKKVAGAGPSGRVPGPVVGLGAPGAPTSHPEPAEEERRATESDSPVRAAGQPSSAPSPGQSVSVSTGRHPEGQTGDRAGQSAYRTEREGTVRVGRGESVVGNPALARRLVELSIAPRDEADLGSRTTKEVLMSSFAGLVLAAHNIFSLEKVYEDSQKLARSCSERVAAAETERDAARESARVTEDREKGLQDEIARLRADGAKSTREAELARRKLAEVQSDLATTRVALGSSGAAVETAQSESRAFQLEAQSAKEQARLAEKEAEMAKRAAVRAVETYKASADHTSDLVASSRLFYVTGFANCKKEVGEAFPNLDLSAILEPVFVGAGQASGSETEDESEGETTEGAPTAGQTAQVDQVPSEPPQILIVPTDFELVDLTGGSTEERAPAAAPSGEPAMDPGLAPVGVVAGSGAPESSIV